MKVKVKNSTAKKNSPDSRLAFSKFLQDPMIAGALLVFAFIALMFALNEFVAARGF